MHLIHTTTMFVVCALANCAGTEAVSSTTTTSATVPTTPVVVTNNSAVETVADTRCAREYACNNIGEALTWETSEECLRDERLSAFVAIRPSECPRGIDASALQDCLTAIESQQCGALGRPAACNKSEVCR